MGLTLPPSQLQRKEQLFMTHRIQQYLRTANTWAVTGIVIVIAVALANGMNFVFSRAINAPLTRPILIFGTIDAIVIPALIAPLILTLLKRAANLRDMNRELEREVNDRQQAEQAAKRRAANLQAISELAVECAAALPEADLAGLIAAKFAAITGALGVSVATYEREVSALVVRHVVVAGPILSKMNEMLGRNVIGLATPVTPDTYRRMLTEVVLVSHDLTETTFGAVARPIAAAVQRALGIGSFTGLALCYGGELWGTAVIVARADQPPMDRELALALANVSAVALRRKKAEDALRHEKQLSDDIINGLPGIFFMCDDQARLVRWNDHHGQVLGYSADELAHMRATDFVAESDREQVVARVRQVFAEGYADLDIPVMTKADQPVPYHLVGRRTVLDGHAYLLGFGVDVTEREALLAQLRAKNVELERFTYTVSHDLRSPLITIRGFVGFMEKDIAAGNLERARADITRIAEATDKMQRLLGELLELSRIGRMMNPPQAAPFEAIAREAVELVRGRINERGVQIVIAPDLPVVYGDRTRLVQVVQNLVENACKFMGEQPQPRIEIGPAGLAADGKPIVFVRDNGLGIAPEFQAQVFGLFDKLDARIEGAGIGLSLVKRIIEVHGGRIWVESAGAGTGSTFYFALPSHASSKED